MVFIASPPILVHLGCYDKNGTEQEAFKQCKFISPSCGERKSKVLADLVSGEIMTPGS